MLNYDSDTDGPWPVTRTVACYTALLGRKCQDTASNPAWCDWRGTAAHDSAAFADAMDSELATVYRVFVEREALSAHVATHQLPAWMYRAVDYPRGSRGLAASDPARRQARRLKIMSHELFPSAEYSLWMDSDIVPLRPASWLIDRYLADCDVCVLAPRTGRCMLRRARYIYEAGGIPEIPYLDAKALQAQRRRYLQAGFPASYGAADTAIVLRRHTSDVCRLNEIWWNEVAETTLWDAFAFVYASWRTGVRYSQFPFRDDGHRSFGWLGGTPREVPQSLTKWHQRNTGSCTSPESEVILEC